MALKFYRKESNVFDSDTTMVTRSGTSRSKLVLLFLVLLIGAGLIFAGIRFLSLNGGTGGSSSPLASLTPTPFTTATPQRPTPTLATTPAGTTTPTPSSKVTPTPTGTKTTPLTLEILNGSGQAGVAGTAASALKKLGYRISGTDNAATFNYVGYTIKIKKSKSSQLPELKKDVATLGTVTDSLTTLPESSDADAQVIVGK